MANQKNNFKDFIYIAGFVLVVLGHVTTLVKGNTNIKSDLVHLTEAFTKKCEAAEIKYEQIEENKTCIAVLQNDVTYIKDMVRKIYNKVG